MKLPKVFHTNIQAKKTLTVMTFLAVLILVFCFVPKYAATNVAKKRIQNHVAKHGTLKWFAETAKAKGSKEIVIPGPKVENVDEINSLEDAFSAYTVVIAEPIEKRSFIDGDRNILTWYRFKILDNLSRKDIHSCSTCPYPPNIPSEISSVASDEILIAHYGGTVEIEGIKVTMKSNEYPDLNFHQQYLIFLEVDSPGQFARVAVGTPGIFTIDPEGSLRSITEKNHPLKDHMNSRYADSSGKLSLAKLKEHIKEFSKANGSPRTPSGSRIYEGVNFESA